MGRKSTRTVKPALNTICVTWSTPNEITNLNSVPKLNNQTFSQGFKIHGWIKIATWAFQLLQMDFGTMTGNITTGLTMAWGLSFIFCDQKLPTPQTGRMLLNSWWHWRTWTQGDVLFMCMSHIFLKLLLCVGPSISTRNKLVLKHSVWLQGQTVWCCVMWFHMMWKL